MPYENDAQNIFMKFICLLGLVLYSVFDNVRGESCAAIYKRLKYNNQSVAPPFYNCSNGEAYHCLYSSLTGEQFEGCLYWLPIIEGKKIPIFNIHICIYKCM